MAEALGVVHKPSFPNRDPMEIAFEDRCSRFDRYLKRLRANGDKQWGLVILEKSAHHELPAEPPPNRDPLRRRCLRRSLLIRPPLVVRTSMRAAATRPRQCRRSPQTRAE